jgi:lichenan operon transcriptional antiterminator
MLNQKEKMILNYLSQDSSRYVTSKELADHLSCTDRTVRTYLKNVSQELTKLGEGVVIESKQGFGYRLSIQDEKLYQQFLTDHHIQNGMANAGISDRHHFILNQLMFEQEGLLFEDLMDQLFVSRSTLSADFKKIRQLLEKYHLTIESRANKGVYVAGSEQDKRHFIMDYFFSGQFMKNIHQYVRHDVLKLPINFEELTMVILDESRSQGLKLSDFVIQNLVVHIALAIKRLESGFQISVIDLDAQRYEKEILVAKNILHRIRQVTQIDFPHSEVNYIALHLISKGQKGERTFDDGSTNQLRQEILSALQRLDRETDYHFSGDFTLSEGLLTHLEVLMERLENDVHLDNPLLDEITSNYLDAFNLTRTMLSYLDMLQVDQLSEDEIAYIALHIMAALERYKEEHKPNALVICATGFGSAQMLRHRIQNELSQYVNVAEMVGYYDINDEKLAGVDCIISTIDLSNLVFAIPVYKVSVFLKDEEVTYIKKELSKLTAKKSKQNLRISRGKLTDFFDDYFSKDYFAILEETDKDAVLRHLVSLLNDGSDDQYEQEMLDLMNQRSKMSTVVFDETIAVPHPIKALDKDHKIAVAIVKNGLVWDDYFKQIQLVFLISSSIYGNEGLADITRGIVDLVDMPALKEKMVACQDFEEFKELFLSLDQDR